MSNFEIFIKSPIVSSTNKVDDSGVTPAMYFYLSQNFFRTLNTFSVNENNAYHFFDALIAMRTFYASVGFDELVAGVNSILDNMVNLLGDVKDKYKYRNENYTESSNTTFIKYINELQGIRLIEKKKLPTPSVFDSVLKEKFDNKKN